MACSYLMSLDDSPTPPRNEQNYTAKEWAKVRAEEWMKAVPSDDHVADNAIPISPAEGGAIPEEAESADSLRVTELQTASTQRTESSKTKSSSDTLSNVLELHTARRMKTPSNSSETVKQGVSIPSQRRVRSFLPARISHG